MSDIALSINIPTISVTLSAVAAITLAIIAVKQLNNICKQYRDAHEWNRRKTTADMANSIVQGEEYLTIRAALLEHGFDIKDQSSTFTEVYGALSNEDKIAVSILLNRMFNMFECFCVALKHNLVDETIAKDLLMLYFIAYYQKYRPFLIQENQRENRPGAFCEFLLCAKRWESEYEQEVSEQDGVTVYRSSRKGKTSLGY